MVRKNWVSLLAVLLMGLALGCSSGGERNKNKNADRPVAGEAK